MYVENDIYILDLNIPRSFHVNPYVFFITNKRDIGHEISHYFFGGKIKSKTNDIWHEILSESLNMLFLKVYFPMYYENELELKFIGYYEEPYGKKVLSFMSIFDYNIQELIDLKRYLINNYNKMNDKKFYNIINNWRN